MTLIRARITSAMITSTNRVTALAAAPRTAGRPGAPGRRDGSPALHLAGPRPGRPAWFPAFVAAHQVVVLGRALSLAAVAASRSTTRGRAPPALHGARIVLGHGRSPLRHALTQPGSAPPALRPLAEEPFQFLPRRLTGLECRRPLAPCRLQVGRHLVALGLRVLVAGRHPLRAPAPARPAQRSPAPAGPPARRLGPRRPKPRSGAAPARHAAGGAHLVDRSAGAAASEASLRCDASGEEALPSDRRRRGDR